MKSVALQVERNDQDKLVVASGNVTRNREFWSGKFFRIVPSGIRTDAWAANGKLVLWMHNMSLPLGSAPLFLEDGKLFSRPSEFDFHRQVLPLENGGTFDTGVIADLWKDKYLNAASVHIRFTDEDIENIIETDTELIFPTSELLEFSVVTIPGDRDAVRQAVFTMGHDPEIYLKEINMPIEEFELAVPVSEIVSELAGNHEFAQLVADLVVEGVLESESFANTIQERLSQTAPKFSVKLVSNGEQEGDAPDEDDAPTVKMKVRSSVNRKRANLLTIAK